MASQIEAIEIKRKMFFEHEGAPYHCIDVEVSRPTARVALRFAPRVMRRDTSSMATPLLPRKTMRSPWMRTCADQQGCG